MARDNVLLRLLIAASPFIVIAGVGVGVVPSVGADDHGHAPAAPAKPAASPDKHDAGSPSHTPPHTPAHNESTGTWSTGPSTKRQRPAFDDDDVFAPPAAPSKAAGSAPAGPAHDNHAPKAPQGGHADPDAASARAAAMTALARLKKGNARWAAARTQDPNTDTSRRESTATNGQTPFATILTCADSRLPVERVFDTGVGDLFVIRVAGNVAGDSETGTIEYGVGHLHVPLLVVMGHTRCGAVAAAVSAAANPDALPAGPLGALVGRIGPAVTRAQGQHQDASQDTLVAASIRENVWQTTFDLLRTSAELRHAVRDGKLVMVGAVCDIATGKVEFLGEHPWQSELVAAFDARSGSANDRRQAGADEHHDDHDTGH